MNIEEIKGPFILDSNVFIEAHRRYYGLDLCPGFWTALKHHFENGNLFSLDRVKQELEGEDNLWEWIKDNLPGEFFHSTGSPQVTEAFSELMVWVNSEPQYVPAARAEFASVADGWLPAYSIDQGGTVVTHEELAPAAKKRIPLPNVCEKFDVPYIDTFEMLRFLETEFHWDAPNS
ncbi:DUF4411 family protein [Puniceicoccaceae bacterium K14]|nr:DUF4411 family protein [Puniceicoccaceae bacterium K14]